MRRGRDKETQTNCLTALRQELGVSKHIPITHLNSPTVFESSTGTQAMVLALEGVSFDTAGDEQLNLYKTTWHRALTALDENFSCLVTVHRHREDIHLSGDFASDFARDLDRRYHAQFQNSALYVNDIYLTVIYKGITTGKVGKGIHAFKKLSNKVIASSRRAIRFSQLKHLTQAVHQLKISLEDFSPRILGENDCELGYSEVLNFLSLIVNAGESSALRLPLCTPAISRDLGRTLFNDDLYPHGNVAQYLPRKRLFFGDCIQFQGDTREDVTFGAMVTIKRYGTQSASIMLDPLLHLSCDFISTHSFAIEAQDLVQERIKRHVIKMHNVNDPAVSQIDQLHEARDLIASNHIKMGYHHNTLLLLSKTKADLEKVVAKAIKCYSDAGFVAVKETLGQEAAFWSQIPTNFKYIARSSLITSMNFCDFAPLHNYKTGYRDGNHLGSAVSLLETPSQTPYFFNYHAKGSQDNPSKGHTMIIGGNNSGKTVFLTLMDAQMSRYGGNTFYFDRDRGAEIYIRACGGSYATLSPNHPGDSRFNPLQLDDTPSNREFNEQLLCQFCKNPEEAVLEAHLSEQLKACVDYGYEKLTPEHRTLTNITQLLPANFPRWSNLRRYLRASNQQAEGNYAYLFDNAQDQLSLHNTMGFDMTHFLDQEPPQVIAALMMYLCHRIDLALTGQRVSIILDEGWQYFQDPYWQVKLAKWLPSIRKRNGHIILATQSPSSVIHSPIRSQITDNVATQIYFANPQARLDEYCHHLKLTEAEFQVISQNAPQSRLFLVKQDHSAVLCRLNLSHLPDLLVVLSGNTRSVSKLDTLREQLGDEPKGWLPFFYKPSGPGEQIVFPDHQESLSDSLSSESGRS